MCQNPRISSPACQKGCCAGKEDTLKSEKINTIQKHQQSQASKLRKFHARPPPGGLRRGPRQRGKTKQSRQITSTPIQKDQKSPETLSKFLKRHAPPTWEAAERSPPEKKNHNKSKKQKTHQHRKLQSSENFRPRLPGGLWRGPRQRGKTKQSRKTTSNTIQKHQQWPAASPPT